jgi:PAS domain S-box-containing protein
MAICYLSSDEANKKGAVATGRPIDFDSFCAVFDASQQGVFIHKRHKPLYVNQAWASLLGYERDELLALDILAHLVAPEFRERLLTYNTNRHAGRPAPTRYHFQVLSKHGERLWVEVFVQQIDWFGEPAVQCTVIDTPARDAAITERLRRAEDAKELFLLALEESSEGLILYDRDHRLLVWNHKLVEMYPELDGVLVPGLPYQAVLQARVDRGAVQEAVGREAAWVEERCQAFGKQDGWIDLQTADGKWYQLSQKVLADGRVLQTSADITERRQAEQALIEERVLLRAIIDNIPDAIFAKDHQARYILKNRFDAELMGAKSTAETIGKTDFDYYPEDVAKELYDLDMQVIEQGASIIRKEQCVTAIGCDTPTWLSTTKVPLKNADGEIIGLVGCSRDITERKAMEFVLTRHRDHLEQLVAERTAEIEAQRQIVEDALDKERDLNALQRHFVSMVCHEFRTPLSVIDGNAQRVLRRHDKIAPDRIRQSMEKIRLTISRLTELMETVLSAARLEAGTIAFDPQPCNPVDIIVDVCSIYHDVYPDYQITTDLEGLPTVFRMDIKLIRQVLSNLVSNAIKYSPDGSKVWIRGHAEDDGAISISVRDEGVGIPEAELQRLFNRFFRASTSTGIAGTGIGLNMAKSLVEMHDGTIRVESVEGRGTMFTIWLPDAEIASMEPAECPSETVTDALA